MPTPSIMRMVLFVLPDGVTVRPAVIHDVHSDNCVSLSVFTGSGDYGGVDALPVVRETSVLHDQDRKGPRTWHWNEHQIQTGKPSH